jgi:hypothetical protein
MPDQTPPSAPAAEAPRSATEIAMQLMSGDESALASTAPIAAVPDAQTELPASSAPQVAAQVEPATQTPEVEEFDVTSLFKPVIEDGNVTGQTFSVDGKEITFKTPDETIAFFKEAMNAQAMRSSADSKFKAAAQKAREVEESLKVNESTIRQQAESAIMARLKPQLDQLALLQQQQLAATPLLTPMPTQGGDETDEDFAARANKWTVDNNANLVSSISRMQAEAERKATESAQALMAQAQAVLDREAQNNAARAYETQWFDANNVPPDQRDAVRAKGEELFTRLSPAAFEGKDLGDVLTMAKMVHDAEMIMSKAQTVDAATATAVRQWKQTKQVQGARSAAAPAPINAGASGIAAEPVLSKPTDIAMAFARQAAETERAR